MFGHGALHGGLPVASAWNGMQMFGHGAFHGGLPAVSAWNGAQVFGHMPYAPFYHF
jgi:hypothetical protein